jgi:hypothetical protein
VEKNQRKRDKALKRRNTMGNSIFEEIEEENQGGRKIAS